ncbi:MAG: response regulator [Rhodospirillales bacterium]|nr:response regulator [Alphaproteobacteria bacterium]MCB9981502.1 response regulator [Rhodospirillales bacterium]
MVIVKNTENIFLQELKNCWESFPTHRCLHLKFSQLEQDKEEWFDNVLAALRSVLEDKSAQLYLCHDNDIFVLTRYVTQKRVDNFLAHLTPILAPAPAKELVALFEIGVHWAKLRTLCEKKIENIKLERTQKQEHAKKKEEIAQLNREETLKTLNKDLIDSISKRRAGRDMPEIMVVEDDLFSQRLVDNALKNKYLLSMTGDGQGAIMSYVNKAPDVLFLDIGLPDINGHEVLEKLFKLDPDAYVVMFSGKGDKENVMKAIELGAKGFVGKPFTQEKLLQYIQKSPFIQAKQNREKTHGNFVH